MCGVADRESCRDSVCGIAWAGEAGAVNQVYTGCASANSEALTGHDGATRTSTCHHKHQHTNRHPKHMRCIVKSDVFAWSFPELAVSVHVPIFPTTRPAERVGPARSCRAWGRQMCSSSIGRRARSVQRCGGPGKGSGSPRPAIAPGELHCFALGLEGLAVPKVSLQGAASQRQVPLLEQATQDRHGRQKAFLNHRSCGAFAFCRHTILL